MSLSEFLTEMASTNSSSWLFKGTAQQKDESDREAVLEQNAIFALNIVREALGERVDLTEKNGAYQTLSTCVGQVLANCEAQIRALVNQLDLSRGSLFPEKFASLADELFEADRGYDIRWERIVTLFAFTWVLSQRLHQGQLMDHGSSPSSSSTAVSKILAGYLNDKIATWIQQRGGWVNFTKSICLPSFCMSPNLVLMLEQESL